MTPTIESVRSFAKHFKGTRRKIKMERKTAPNTNPPGFIFRDGRLC